MRSGYSLRNAVPSKRHRLAFRFVWVVVLPLLVACADNPNLSGEWRSRNGSALIISQEGNKYFVKAGSGDFMGRFKEDGIAIDSPVGDVKYSREKDKLFWAGEEYSRKEKLEADARRIRTEMENFVGLWKKIPHEGGQAVAALIAIDLTPGSDFQIAEIDSFYGSSAFRNPQYNDGAITGTFWFTIDNEHQQRFEIRKTDRGDINVTMGNGEPEAFRRHIETDAFTGNWSGYYPNDKEPTFSFTITKVVNRYKIAKTHLGTSSTLFGALRNGKVVAEGNPSDFYKFQPPTIEMRSDGALWYSDGADDVKLTRIK